MVRKKPSGYWEYTWDFCWVGFCSFCSLAVVQMQLCKCRCKKWDKAEMFSLVVSQALESDRFGCNSDSNIYWVVQRKLLNLLPPQFPRLQNGNNTRWCRIGSLGELCVHSNFPLPEMRTANFSPRKGVWCTVKGDVCKASGARQPPNSRIKVLPLGSPRCHWSQRENLQMQTQPVGLLLWSLSSPLPASLQECPCCLGCTPITTNYLKS